MHARHLWLLIVFGPLVFVIGVLAAPGPIASPPVLSAPAAPAGGSPTTTPTAPACGYGAWHAVAPYPIPISVPAVVGHGGQLYSFGGLDTGSYSVDNAYRYDPTANAWIPLAPLPEVRSAVGIASDGTYIYILNGISVNTVRNTLYRYDPAANSYTLLAPAPVATWGHASALLGGRLYRIAGCTVPNSSCAALSSVDVYTISTNTWAPAGTIADYPLALAWLRADAAGGYIYGGGGGSTPATYRYDPATNSWDDAAVTDLPYSYITSASDILNGRWIMGGTRFSHAMDLGNPTGAWAALPPMPAWVTGAGGATVGGGFYSVGGYDSSYVTQPYHFVYTEVPCPTPTVTGTPPTATPPPTITRTPTGAPSATRTTTTTPPPATTGTSISTRTPAPTAPSTPPGTVTAPTATRTVAATATTGGPAPTNTPGSITSTPCPLQFSDVPASQPFYVFIRCLACRGIVSGYSDGTFRPGANVTRGQLSKILANAAGLGNAIPSTQQTFTDVPTTQPFWLFIERLAGQGAINGYGCGGAGEPCDPLNRPYFRPGNDATRGQIAKITAVAAAITDPIPSTRQTFTDVPSSNPFWLWIEQLAGRNIISGYADGTFRWGNDATRGQMSKIAANAFFPNCATPARR